MVWGQNPGKTSFEEGALLQPDADRMNCTLALKGAPVGYPSIIRFLRWYTLQLHLGKTATQVVAPNPQGEGNDRVCVRVGGLVTSAGLRLR